MTFRPETVEERRARAERAVLSVLAIRPLTRGEIRLYARMPRPFYQTLWLAELLSDLVRQGLVEKTTVPTSQHLRGAFHATVRLQAYRLVPATKEGVSH